MNKKFQEGKWALITNLRNHANTGRLAAGPVGRAVLISHIAPIDSMWRVFVADLSSEDPAYPAWLYDHNLSLSVPGHKILQEIQANRIKTLSSLPVDQWRRIQNVQLLKKVKKL